VNTVTLYAMHPDKGPLDGGTVITFNASIALHLRPSQVLLHSSDNSLLLSLIVHHVDKYQHIIAIADSQCMHMQSAECRPMLSKDECHVRRRYRVETAKSMEFLLRGSSCVHSLTVTSICSIPAGAYALNTHRPLCSYWYMSFERI